MLYRNVQGSLSPRERVQPTLYCATNSQLKGSLAREAYMLDDEPPVVNGKTTVSKCIDRYLVNYKYLSV